MRLKKLLATVALSITMLLGVSGTALADIREVTNPVQIPADSEFKDGSQYISYGKETDVLGELSNAYYITSPSGKSIQFHDSDKESLDSYRTNYGTDTSMWYEMNSETDGVVFGTHSGWVHFYMDGQFYKYYINIDDPALGFTGAGKPTVTASEPKAVGDGLASVWYHIEAPNGVEKIFIGAERGINGLWCDNSKNYCIKGKCITSCDLEILYCCAQGGGIRIVDTLGYEASASKIQFSNIIPYFNQSVNYNYDTVGYNNAVSLYNYIGTRENPKDSFNILWNTDGSAKLVDRTTIPGTDWTENNRSEEYKLHYPDKVAQTTPKETSAASVEIQHPTEPVTKATEPQTEAPTTQVQTIASTEVATPETTSIHTPESTTAKPTTTQPTVPETTSAAQETTAPEPSAASAITETLPKTTSPTPESTTAKPTTTQPTVPETTSAAPEAAETLAPVQSNRNVLPVIAGIVVAGGIFGGAAIWIKRNKK